MGASRAAFFLVSALLVCFALAQGPVTAPAAAPAAPAAGGWAWCVSDAADKTMCDKMVLLLANIDVAHKHSCVQGSSVDDCMKRINAGTAQFGVFDGSFIDTAAKNFSMKPIRTEGSSAGLDNQYYAVGIIKKSACPAKLSDLKGKRSCHSGYGRSAGWTLPVAAMIEAKVIPIVSKTPADNDAESVQAFFSKTCAASSTPAKSICTGCKTTTGCTTADVYYDYEGAFRGVVEGACDIAFTKFTIPVHYSLGGRNALPWTGLEAQSAYNLVCGSGTKVCDEISAAATCNFGSAPPHTIMVASNYPDTEINAFNAMMDKANSDVPFSELFFSGKNADGSIFSSDAIKTFAYNGTALALTSSINSARATIAKVNETPTEASGAAKAIASGAFVVVSAVVSIFFTL